MNTKKEWIWSLVALALAVLTIYIVISGSGMTPAQLAGAVSRADPLWFSLALLSVLGMLFFEGVAILAIMKAAGYPQPFRRGFLYASANAYFSAITPSATGGQPAVVYFLMKDGVPAMVATAGLLVNLVVYNAAILSCGVFCLLLRPGLFLHFQPVCRLLIVAGFLVLLGMGILFFFLLWEQRLLHGIASRAISLLTRMRLMRHPEKWEEKLRKAMEEYGSCVRIVSGQRAMWVKAYICNVLQRVCQFLVTVFVYLAITGQRGISLDLWITQCFVSLGANCVPIPGSMGVTDYLMLDGYLNLMDKTAAYELQILARGLSFYCCVLLAALVSLGGYLLRRKRKKRT